MADRITQTSAEVFVVPNTQKIRVSQTSAEVFVVPDTQKIRVSQSYMEVFVKDSVVSAGAERVQVIWAGG